VSARAAFLALAALWLAAPGRAEPPPGPEERPKVYALVAAVGTEFRVAVEGIRTGSHIDYYRRKRVQAPENVLNSIVLQSLDKELAQLQPGSQRVYLSVPAADLDSVPTLKKDDVAIAKVVAALEKMPQRAQWERIVVATPAYAAFERNGVAGKLQGLGVSIHPLKGGLSSFFNLPAFVDDMHGDEALTPEGKIARTEIYLAPYSYLTIWVLDPKTLAVLDKQERFDHQKLANPTSGTLDMVEGVGREFIARQVIAVIGRSVHEAVRRTELNGQVDVHEVREAKPGEAEPPKR
jgi:hypothetical protein